ncbi:MAG: type IIL restriction-modification enzyme MmeI [Chloroflexota bacterium]
MRSKNRRMAYAEKWWQYAEARPGMRAALLGKSRFIATPRVSKHRIFVWLKPEVLANDGTIVFARDDDFSFGVLHSKIHELWARGTGTQLREAESGFRYTPTSTFETFPFPRPTAKQKKAIAEAARELNEKRESWLNPYKDQPAAIREDLKKRTLTNLYNERPTWLHLAHEKLDRAVLDAYGWPGDLSDDGILARLLAENLRREPAKTSKVSEGDEEAEEEATKPKKRKKK